MEGWEVGRLLSAGEFTGNFLKLRLAVLLRGEEPLLLLEVVSDPDLDADDIDGKSSAKWSPRFRIPVPAGWEVGSGNPWSLCRYAGPLRSSTVADVDGLIADLSGGGKNMGARLAALIEAHLDAPLLDLRTRRLLLQFLKKDFQPAKLSTLIRPEESDNYDLTLVAAQEIHQAAASGRTLTATQRRHAEVLLKYAPWQFGYWGPFKALVKSVPVEQLADAYADAVARLSRIDGKPSVPAKTLIEVDEELDGWFGIPSRRTQQYLARRVRRDLASLAERSPAVYAKVASRMLVAWDESLSNYSYAPAFVLLGAESPLDSRSRYVRRPADMTIRRDAHPEVWDARPELVENVFRSIRSSVEALTWACQVLDANGAAPELPSASTALALNSPYLPLRQLGWAALTRQPELLWGLTEDQWTAFFRHGSDADVAAVADALSHQQLAPSLGAAIGAVLAQPEALPGRRTRLALLYLAAPKIPFTKHADADVAAVVETIKDSGLEHRTLWEPVVSKLGPWALFEAFRSIVGVEVNDAASDMVANALLGQTNHPPDLILECIGSDTVAIVDLGWRIVDSHGGRHFLFTQLFPSAGPGDRISPEISLRVVTAALPRAEEAQDVAAVLRWALSTDIDRSQMVRLLAGIRLGATAVWEALAADKDNKVAALATENPELIQLMGEALTDQQVQTANPSQLRLLINYITSNPSRMAQEEQLCVAALRSTDESLQTTGLQHIRASGFLDRTWLAIAESGSPAGLQVAREYLESLTNTEQIRQSILECLASSSSWLRDIGIQLFRRFPAVAEDSAIMAALGGSDDQLAQDVVAVATSSGGRVDDGVLQDFDRRVLTDQKASPRAKESVKKRLETSDPSLASVSPDRLAAVLHLARSGSKRDREWALMRLATWALHGANIEGLEVSLTTEGTVGLEDVAQ